MAVEQIIQSSVFSSPLLMPLLAIVFVLSAVHFWQITRRERKMGDLLPGPPAFPIIGNAYYFLNSNHGNALNNNLKLNLSKFVNINQFQKFSTKLLTSSIATEV